jgi:hypothetical protein
MSNRRKLRQPMPVTFVDRNQGRWNGERVAAVRVRVVVADAQFPEYWARELVGTERAAVRVTYHGRVFYLDDEDGSGWHKVTHGGGPGLPHRDLAVEREVPLQASEH